ncbi:hypothetical protein EDD18DRAFT_1113735 [Armillaria luteobubalina]|uniref:Uncharacterized protein n=1 Tax=Armillaria luteobubalina TaxID=153913 RepID=A0AA39TCE5_9AGAR|nr:hypothetical protein EDD18DRAFT_1113735 [Armillaria luteobubalina]
MEHLVTIDQDDVVDSKSDFNVLGLRARDFGLRVRPIPSDRQSTSLRVMMSMSLPHKSATPVQQQRAQAPLRATTPSLPSFQEAKTPIPLLKSTSAMKSKPSAIGNSGWGLPARSLAAFANVSPPSPATNSLLFCQDLSTPLHARSSPTFKIGQPPRSKPSPSRLPALNASRPDLTEEEEKPDQDDFFSDSLVKDAVTGTDDEGSSPPPTDPTNKARRLQARKVSFIFDDPSGNALDPHPTIILPRPQIRAPQEPLLRRSTRHKSPPSDDASQEPKDKKDEKSAKERLGVGSKKDDKDKAKELGLSNVPEALNKPTTKKLKLNGVKVDAVAEGINNFEDTLNAMMEGNAAIASIAQQSLAGLDITAYFEAIRVHISRLRECLNSAEEVDEGGKDSEDDSADNGAEGVAGPSMK